MSEKAEVKDDTSVRVALRIRPQLARERIDMCQVCTQVIPEEQQVVLGKDKAFTFDHVFDIPTKQETIYEDCVKALIEGCFEGYNATVFAYGQTGSGKTYTMGTGFDINIPEDEIGIIPRAVDHLFKGIEERRRIALEKNELPPDFKVNAQFMELYNEEILDLMDTTRDPEARGRKSHIKIHEDAEGGIYVVGVATRHVVSLNDTIECLKAGALCRSTASTNMNSQSSRSHAIFTLHIKQHRAVHEESLVEDENAINGGQELNEFETLTAKFHFVDLAGSERLKRTGATGDRAKEGISINCGLLALGNVISALGDVTKKGSHVPYRDSKLTRLLQDSLGGNSRTLMIACVSPSDRDFMETLNTLKYANRARNIKNKVIANQDKASKQLAALRAEILMLQQELNEYKSGKRVVDNEGMEGFSDMYHESTMLQSENDKLRQRIKSLNETVESLTVRNTDLLADKALQSLGNGAGDAASAEVVDLVKGYIKELEELRAKLAESEATCENMKRSMSRSMASSRLSISPMPSPIQGARPFDIPMSPDNTITTILEEAKKDVRRGLKKMKRSTSRLSQGGSDKENQGSDDEKDQNEVQEKDQEEIREKDLDIFNNNELEEDQLVGDDEEDEVDEDEVSSSSSDTDSEGKDSDNIHEDLAELTCEISIKQKLIEELETSQKRLHALKVQYEEKVMQLQSKIKETELERDKMLSNIGQVETNKAEQTKKVKEQYERKLNDMQNELKKLQAAKKEHAKLVKNQSHYEKQLKTLQHELGEMKKTKVRLMKQMKEDAEKNKQLDLRRNKEISQLRKEQLKKEGLIRNLEKEKKQKDTILKRKQEEVEALRKKHRPMSNKAAGRVGRYDRPTTIPLAPITSSPRRRRRAIAIEFNAKAAKQKWDNLEKNISSVVNKKQTISNMEKDMDVWLKHREKLGKKHEKYIKKREAAVAEGKSEEEIKELNDVIESLHNQLEFAQDNISECQTNIMQMEEAKDEGECIDPASVISMCSLEEARYLLEHFVSLSVSKGMQLANKESEARELNAKLHQTELNNTLQQDLLKHMMVDRVDIEVDNLMTNQVDEMDSSTSSSSSSPVDSMFESKIEPVAPPVKSTSILSAGDSAAARREKARRKTATPEDLLYAGADGSTAVPVLHPVMEAPDEHHHPPPAPLREVKEPPTVNGTTETTLMPPPRTLPPKQSSTSRLPSASPSLRRKEFPRPSPEPSPVLRRKNSFTLVPRPSSADTATSSDTTPPSSPQPSRRMDRSSDENVFSRLTSNAPGISQNNPKRGSIVAAPARISNVRSSPLTCTHTAEGHTKAILSVCCTEDLLFTSSKDRTAKAWDLQSGKEFLSFSGHPNNVNVVKYCEALRLVFTVSQSYVNVWDIRDRTSKCVKTLSSSGLTQNGPVNFTSSSRQIELPPGEHHINDIALNKSGTLLYSATGNVVRVWDLRRFDAIGKLNGGHQAAVMVLAVDTNNGSDTVVTGSKDHYIKVFEVLEEAAGVLTPKYNLEPPHYDGIQSLAVQGETLFSGSRDTCIKKWDLGSQQLVQSLNSAHKDWICALDFMPGTNTLLSGCRAGCLKMWQGDTCSQLAEIRAHSSPINAIATNSSCIFTASNDHTVRLWRQKSSLDPSDSSDNIQDDRHSTSS